MSLEHNFINWEMVRRYSEQYGHIVPNVRFGKDAVVPDRSQFVLGDINIQPKWDIPNKIMINTTICGGFFSKETNPNIPITTQEIYQAARDICLAGAPMLHVHVRDDEGYNTLDPDKFHEVLDPIRQEFPDVIIDGCLVANRAGYWEKMELLLKEHLFDITPINATSNYAGDRLFTPYPHHIIEKAELVMKYNVKPHIAVFTDGDVDTAYRYLISTKLIEPPYDFGILPALPGCSSMNSPTRMLEGLMRMNGLIQEAAPGAHVIVCCSGRASSYLAAASMLLGLHVRVGMEDTPWVWPHKDDLITNNAKMFTMFKQMAQMLGREVYTPAEYREVMQIAKR